MADRSLAEHVCLAVIAEAPTHGWAVARRLAPDGDVGRVWSLSRPLTYRAIRLLVEGGLVAESRTEPGRGPTRTILTITPAGRRAARRWVGQPVAHLREVRTELLCKLLFVERLGGDRNALLRAQQRAFAPSFAALAERARSPGSDAVDRWRHASSEAIARFLATELPE